MCFSRSPVALLPKVLELGCWNINGLSKRSITFGEQMISSLLIHIGKQTSDAKKGIKKGRTLTCYAKHRGTSPCYAFSGGIDSPVSNVVLSNACLV